MLHSPAACDLDRGSRLNSASQRRKRDVEEDDHRHPLLCGARCARGGGSGELLAANDCTRGHAGTQIFASPLRYDENWGDPVIGVHRTYLSDNIRRGLVWSNTQNFRNPRVDELLAGPQGNSTSTRAKNCTSL